MASLALHGHSRGRRADPRPRVSRSPGELAIGVGTPRPAPTPAGLDGFEFGTNDVGFLTVGSAPPMVAGGPYSYTQTYTGGGEGHSDARFAGPQGTDPANYADYVWDLAVDIGPQVVAHSGADGTLIFRLDIGGYIVEPTADQLVFSLDFDGFEMDPFTAFLAPPLGQDAATDLAHRMASGVGVPWTLDLYYGTVALSFGHWGLVQGALWNDNLVGAGDVPYDPYDFHAGFGEFMLRWVRYRKGSAAEVSSSPVVLEGHSRGRR